MTFFRLSLEKEILGRKSEKQKIVQQIAVLRNAWKRKGLSRPGLNTFCRFPNS